MQSDQFPQNFQLPILIASDTARKQHIDNSPPQTLLKNLYQLAIGLEKIACLLDYPLTITSGYRCETLNRRVGGVEDSQHVQGLAADFICPAFGSPLNIAKTIANSAIQFDQLIHEMGRWVHISFAPQGGISRRELLTICPGGTYQSGLHCCTTNQTTHQENLLTKIKKIIL
jgi:zinc D-Ala-D-Ala carboxypeptidase